MTLEETLQKIHPLDEKAMEISRKRWDSIAKPLHSLGKMEDLVVQIAGITGSPDMNLKKRALVAMCADNGVVEEGVTQTGQEVTAIVAENFLTGDTSACTMCRQCGTDVYPVDVGMAVDTKVPTDLKVAMGTRNMVKEPAMTREETVKGIEAGIEMVSRLKAKGYGLLATGEMGIGNTTTSSAVASVLLDRPVEEMTGRGAGLSSDGLNRKITAIKKAIDKHQPDPKDAIDVLAKSVVWTLQVWQAYLSAVLPLVFRCDRWIYLLCGSPDRAANLPTVGDYMIASHVSKEPAAHLILEALGKEAVIHGDMCLGEGSGAVALFPFLDMGTAVYQSMSTFDDIHVEQYEELV